MLDPIVLHHRQPSLVSRRTSYLTPTLLLAVAFLFNSFAAAAPQVWIGSMEPEWRRARGWPENDFLALFEESAPWSKAASMTNVFLITKKFAIEGPDEELKLVIDNLRVRKIALGLQGVPLVATEACGRSIESYGPPHHMAAAAQRIKNLGGTIQYIALDEPLYYGHVFPGNASLHACHSPIDKIAEQTVFSMNEVRKIFPEVRVGDAEPFPVHNPDAGGWIANLAEWVTAYTKANGSPFAFFHFDLIRTTPEWRPQLAAAVPIIRKNGIPLGVIYDGEPNDATDEQWVNSAKALCRIIEGEMRLHPDVVVFQSWTDRPRRMMPDTDQTSLTGLVARYRAGCP